MNIEQKILEPINTMLYNSCAEHSCQYDINTIINMQNKPCECVNDYIDDMSNAT